MIWCKLQRLFEEWNRLCEFADVRAIICNLLQRLRQEKFVLKIGLRQISLPLQLLRGIIVFLQRGSAVRYFFRMVNFPASRLYVHHEDHRAVTRTAITRATTVEVSSIGRSYEHGPGSSGRNFYFQTEAVDDYSMRYIIRDKDKLHCGALLYGNL